MKLCDIKRNNPYIFNSWRGILHTEKGKRVGTSEEWKDFLTFFNDVSSTYRKGLVLRRLYKDNVIPCCIECDKARSDYFFILKR